MKLRPGQRLQSVACDSQIIVVRAPANDVDLRCGGHAVVEIGSDAAKQDLDAAFSEGTAIGKRYGEEAQGIELLCTKAGKGTLSIGPDPLPLKGAKLLPSSD
jgi:hypothetical protein